MTSFSLFILKILFNCFRDGILSMKEESLNEELEAGNQISNEVNEKLQNTLQNKDLTTVSVAQAMIEITYKQIKSANTNIVLMLIEVPVTKKKKGGD